MTATRTIASAMLIALVASACHPGLHLIGDSLVSTPTAQSRLAPVWDDLDAVSGRPMRTSGGLVLESVGSSCVAVALGTNDVATSSLAQMRDNVQNTAKALAGTRCVIFTTVARYASPFYHGQWYTRSGYWNSLVWATGRTVVDWAGISAAHPEYLAIDGLHLTPAGEKAYADAINQAGH